MLNLPPQSSTVEAATQAWIFVHENHDAMAHCVIGPFVIHAAYCEQHNCVETWLSTSDDPHTLAWNVVTLADFIRIMDSVVLTDAGLTLAALVERSIVPSGVRPNHNLN